MLALTSCLNVMPDGSYSLPHTCMGLAMEQCPQSEPRKRLDNLTKDLITSSSRPQADPSRVRLTRSPCACRHNSSSPFVESLTLLQVHFRNRKEGPQVSFTIIRERVVRPQEMLVVPTPE
jgi:hypothetical protein